MPVLFLTGCHAEAVTSQLLLVLEIDGPAPVPFKVPGCLWISSLTHLNEVGNLL